MTVLCWGIQREESWAILKHKVTVTLNCVSLCGSRDVVIQISFPRWHGRKASTGYPSVEIGDNSTFSLGLLLGDLVGYQIIHTNTYFRNGEVINGVPHSFGHLGVMTDRLSVPCGFFQKQTTGVGLRFTLGDLPNPRGSDLGLPLLWQILSSGTRSLAGFQFHAVSIWKTASPDCSG